ncbi:MAG: AAA family ATPase [Conexivisphaerales archaeon]
MPKQVKILITGSPATGKRSVASLICKRTMCKCISINEIASAVPHVTYRNEIVLNRSAVKRRLRSEVSGINSYVIYGNLAWEVVPKDLIDVVVVLRCNPLVLYQRYRQRGYDEEKSKDNVVAEAIGLVYHECLKSFGPMVEVIDVTHESLERIVDRILGGKFDNPSSIDWLELASRDQNLLRLLL